MIEIIEKMEKICYFILEGDFNMLINTFLRKHDFSEHPFAKVAGEKENLLSLYFVEPRYFSEVLGDAKNPRSYVVFGPRGGGKSAIRSTIERYCNDDSFIPDIGGKILCITYDDFSALNISQLNTITLTDHINEILKRGVPKLACELVHLGLVGDNLKEEYRGLLRWYIDEYMSDLSKLELDSILKMLMSQTDKFNEILRGVVDLYNTIIHVLKLEEIKPTKLVEEPKNKRDAISSIHVMEVFTRLATQLGHESVYVLIDKIDETDVTGGDSLKAAKLVTPMLTNIKLLELEHCAFKFFLWDNIRNHFGKELRSDRITMNQTEWNDIELQKMLDKRISAYSLGRTKFSDMFSDGIGYDLSKIVIHFSYHSPRDINRLLYEVFAEAAADTTDNKAKIQWDSFLKGLEKFTNIRIDELYDKDLINKIQRLNHSIFTISDVASSLRVTRVYVDIDEEDISTQSATNRARNLVEKWKKAGLIKQIESTTVISNGRRRSANRYEIIDPRVIYAINQEEVFNSFLISA